MATNGEIQWPPMGSFPWPPSATVEFVPDQLGNATTETTWDIYVHLFRRRKHRDGQTRIERRLADLCPGPWDRTVRSNERADQGSARRARRP
jgi:hypothetical protein